MTGNSSDAEDSPYDGPLVDPIQCGECQGNWMVSDLEFPEPESDTNTQFGWLAATCPGCTGDIQVSWERIKHVFD